MGHMGPSTHSLLTGQLPYFRAGLGSTAGTFSPDMEGPGPGVGGGPGLTSLLDSSPGPGLLRHRPQWVHPGLGETPAGKALGVE